MTVIQATRRNALPTKILRGGSVVRLGHAALWVLFLIFCVGVDQAAGQITSAAESDALPNDADYFSATVVAPDSDNQPRVITVDSLIGSDHVSIPGNTTLRVNNAAANTFDGRLTGGGELEKVGSGDLIFSSISNTNTFHFAGTLALDTGNLEFEGGSASSALTLGTLQLTGGTLLLDASYINVKTLNITGNTILDFGTGSGSVLNVDNIFIADGATLTVKNWSSEVDFLFANSTFRQNDSAGANAEFNVTGTAPENQIVFEGDASGGGNTAWINYNYGGYTNYEIRPIPEPSTYGAIMTAACLGLVAWRRRPRAMEKSVG